MHYQPYLHTWVEMMESSGLITLSPVQLVPVNLMWSTSVEPAQPKALQLFAVGSYRSSCPNIGGKTIHSTLHIVSANGIFRTRAYANKDLNNRLKQVDTIIIDEISMVSAELLDFVSNMSANIHNNAKPFGGINVVVVGDLSQLPPITGQPVFRAASWTLFYPLFLRIPQRQHSDTRFYQMLQEVRMGNISSDTWQLLQQRHSEFTTQPTVDTLLNTTHIVGFRENAQQINRMVCNALPVPNNKFLISNSVDFVNSV